MLKNFLHNIRGAALVEMALTAPVLMLVMVGSAELGRIAYYAIEVQNAARAGAAYGALNVANAFGSSSNIEQAAQNDAPNLTLTFPTAPTQECVCETETTGTPSYNPGSGTGDTTPNPISCYSSGTTLNSDFTSCDAVTSTSQQQVVEYVQVETQATVRAMFPIQFKLWGIGLPTSYTLNGLSRMRVLQN
jgi:Flp pilus assembly protein TadG